MMAIGYIDVFLAIFFKNVKLLKLWWVFLELFNFKFEKNKNGDLTPGSKNIFHIFIFCPKAKNEILDETRYISWPMKTICKIFRRLVNSGELSVTEVFLHFPLHHKWFRFLSIPSEKMGSGINVRGDLTVSIFLCSLRIRVDRQPPAVTHRDICPKEK